MKKMMIGIASVLMLTAVIGTVGVYAAGKGRGTGVCQNASAEQRVNYIDADNDGICDNQSSGKYYTDNDNDGVCDNQNSGKYYTDNNNDGVCDNYSERIRPQDGTGFQRGRDRGCGR